MVIGRAWRATLSLVFRWRMWTSCSIAVLVACSGGYVTGSTEGTEGDDAGGSPGGSSGSPTTIPEAGAHDASAADAGPVLPTGTRIDMRSSCESIAAPGGTMPNELTLIGGCLDGAVMSEMFESECPGASMLDGTLAIVNGSLRTSGANVLRVGDYYLEGDMMAPCADLAGGNCATLGSLVSVAARRNSYEVTFTCVEASAPNTCSCHLIAQGDLPERSFVLDSSAGMLTADGTLYRYGELPLEGLRLQRVDELDSIPLENALVLDYAMP